MNPDVHHETTDVRVRPIVAFGVGLTVLALAVYAVAWWMFDLFAAREARLKPPLSPLARRERPQQPPTPRLEIVPRLALKEMREHEDAILDGYGWVDRERNIVRIPIDRAIDLLVERGLPIRSDEGMKTEDRGSRIEDGEEDLP